MKDFEHTELLTIINGNPPNGIDVKPVECEDRKLIAQGTYQLVIKMVSDWKFYKVFMRIDPNGNTLFLDAKSLEWASSGAIYCREVIPIIKQIVEYAWVEESDKT